MSGMPGRSLELFYIDGRPDGMVTAELFDWTGHVLKAPRTQIVEALARPETRRAGIYLLLGEQDGQTKVYVGESDNIGTRIRQHDGYKDWWTEAVFVTATGNRLNKAHVRYLEARLLERARAIGRATLDNATAPATRPLSEADVAKMQAFIDNLLVVLPAVRVDVFISKTRRSTSVDTVGADAVLQGDAVAKTVFAVASSKLGIRATAVLSDGEFIVQEGSTARPAWEGPPTHSYTKLHAELIGSGVLVPDDRHARFASSYAFNSPSAAAAMVYGRTANGPQSWRAIDTDETFREWEARTLLVVDRNPAAEEG